MRRETGFTLIELLVTIFILGLVLAGITQMFTGILSQYKQQGKIAETSIEGIVGLELLRQDIENAGFGLPWRIPDGVTYQEASAAAAAAYNDCDSAATPPKYNPPRAFVAGSGAGFNGSDVLVIKATNVARNDTAQKWTYINSDNTPQPWNVGAEDLASDDRVIVIFPGTSDTNLRTLVTNSSNNWKTTFGSTADFTPGSGYNFEYGVAAKDPDDPTQPLRMPFNRADYYIASRATSSVPERCAPNTSVLLKTVISHADGVRRDPMPLLDCVADMQVSFQLDRDGDGTAESSAEILSDPTGTYLTAEQIRNQLKEVRVYILGHEGQRDKTYTYPTQKICVGEIASGVCASPGREFDIGGNVNYRWKVYTLIVKPNNLKQ